MDDSEETCPYCHRTLEECNDDPFLGSEDRWDWRRDEHYTVDRYCERYAAESEPEIYDDDL